MRDSGSGLTAAAISSWMARSAALAITEIRYCIVDHLLCFGAPVAGGRSRLQRTAPTRPDTTSRTSFKTLRPPATASQATRCTPPAPRNHLAPAHLHEAVD